MAEDYDVNEEDREDEAKLRKSKIYCRFIMYIMTSIYHFALGKYTYILILAFVMVLSWAWPEIALQHYVPYPLKLRANPIFQSD